MTSFTPRMPKLRPGAQYPLRLSVSEIQVLCLVAEGYSDGEIAEKIGKSVETVKRHGMNIRDKIGADNRVGMARWAYRNELVQL